MFAQGGLNKIVNLQCSPKRPEFTVFYFLSLGVWTKFLIGMGGYIFWFNIPWALGLLFYLKSVGDKQGGYCDNTRSSS